MAINPRRTVLLICDMQERFRGAIYHFDAVAATIAKMVKAAAILEMPVLATEQNPKVKTSAVLNVPALGATVPELGLANLPAHLNLGIFSKTQFSMLTPEVKAAIGLSAVDKTEDGEKEEHHDTCRCCKGHINRVIIVGIESHVCVAQTSLEACDQWRSKPIVLADGVSSCNPQEVPIALRLLGTRCDIMTSESVLFRLMGDAAHPRFREFASLIKSEKNTTTNSLTALLGPSPSEDFEVV